MASVWRSAPCKVKMLSRLVLAVLAALAGCGLFGSVVRAGSTLFVPSLAARGSLFGARCVTDNITPGRSKHTTARQAAKAKMSKRKSSKPKVRTSKLGKSQEGQNLQNVFDYIQEKDKAALEEGAFMDTFLGQLATAVTWGGGGLIILWEIYLNTIYPRKAPMVNIFTQMGQTKEEILAGAPANSGMSSGMSSSLLPPNAMGPPM
eukprot:TRINITY_DN79240_c0_g1_i1.p1 TRINITY_DN79240_c0_g1~~TRINITY_DN79240_c0_g1_i1.p1  ORF type:complete len:205 (-),score=34.89 TRINITY_DN79240_c0_g1_i1:207-821(-)